MDWKASPPRAPCGANNVKTSQVSKSRKWINRCHLTYNYIILYENYIMIKQVKSQNLENESTTLTWLCLNSFNVLSRSSLVRIINNDRKDTSIALIFWDHRMVNGDRKVPSQPAHLSWMINNNWKVTTIIEWWWNNHLTHLERHWEGGSATSNEALRLVKYGVNNFVTEIFPWPHTDTQTMFKIRHWKPEFL